MDEPKWKPNEDIAFCEDYAGPYKSLRFSPTASWHMPGNDGLDRTGGWVAWIKNSYLEAEGRTVEEAAKNLRLRIEEVAGLESEK